MGDVVDDDEDVCDDSCGCDGDGDGVCKCDGDIDVDGYVDTTCDDYDVCDDDDGEIDMKITLWALMAKTM